MKTQTKEAKITKKVLKEVGKIAEELLDKVGVKGEVGVAEDKPNNLVKVTLSSEEETGLLIGRRGENLFAFQSAIGMMLRQKLGDWFRVSIDVGGWREKQEQELEDLANQAVEKARETGKDQPLYNLNAAQRRIIHVKLSDLIDIETESMGEGEERYLIVKPKK
ncbi:hypothetical protein M1545_03475 [Patescibacteria group bacterium]|nr:hypothetical protein [Patescibacteria group bacterium]